MIVERRPLLTIRTGTIATGIRLGLSPSLYELFYVFELDFEFVNGLLRLRLRVKQQKESACVSRRAATALDVLRLTFSGTVT